MNIMNKVTLQAMKKEQGSHDRNDNRHNSFRRNVYRRHNFLLKHVRLYARVLCI